MSKSALILRHLAFEDLGSFAPVLEDEGYRLVLIEAGIHPLPDPSGADLVVVLGGPIGVNDGQSYPSMAAERDWLAPRLATRRPTLGICLGAQLMAAALGAEVAPMSRKEIGFAPLTLTEVGSRGPLATLEGVPVLHWHGETFETPAMAEILAATGACATQAFALGPNLLGLQFHAEAGELPAFERWLIGHSVEIAQAGIAPEDLRRAAEEHGPALRVAGQAMLRAWLRGAAGMTRITLLTGRASPLPHSDAPSGIVKTPVDRPLALGLEGLEGDEQADRRVHGGTEKAVHHYPFDHYAVWRNELGALPPLLAPGGFGENISTSGLTEAMVAVGDVFRLGTAILQVSQGRQPCWKLNRRFDVPDMARRVQQTGRTGWYYRVLQPGTVTSGDRLELIERVAPAWTLHRIWHALYVDRLNLRELAGIAALDVLAEGWRRYAVRRLESGRVEDWSKRLDGTA